jgi:hypothetical protein
VFDPEALYVKPPLRGFRLRAGKYQPLAPAADGSLTSKQLGLRLLPEGHMLRLIDVRSNEPILTRQERAERAELRVHQERQLTKQAQQRANQEQQRADALAAELARLQSQQGKRGGKNR